MTPEEKKQFENMKKELGILNDFVDSLKNSSTIPYEIDSSFRDRFAKNNLETDTTSKGLTSEQHGASAVGLKNPEKWLTIQIDGIIYFIPAYI